MTLKGRFGDPRTERDILSAKRFNFFALIVLIVLIIAAFLMYLQLINQQRELQVRTQQLADSATRLRLIRSELEAAQKSLIERETRVEQNLIDLSASVENRQFDSALVKARGYSTQIAQKDSTETLLVNLYAWEPNRKALHAMENAISEPDYLLAKMETLTQQPEWYDEPSSVHYYSDHAKSKASRLATQLSKIAGKPFALVKGDPAEVPNSEYHHWARIYYVGNQR